MREIYFDYPYAAFLIPLAFVLIFFMISLFRHRQRCIQKFTALSHLPHLLHPRSWLLTMIKNLSWVLVWFFGCLALMGPKGNLSYFAPELKAKEQELVKIPKKRPHDIILLIDTSASMNVKDASGGLSRLEKGKQIMSELVGLLDGQSVALEVFTSDLNPVVPPTLDYIFTRLIIKEIFINEGYSEGTDLEKTFLALRQRMFEKPNSKIYTLVLLSDGGDNRLEKSTGSEKKQREKAILAALPDKNQFNLKIFTVGLGSHQGDKVPGVLDQGQAVKSVLFSEILQQIAKEGRGMYYEGEKWTSRALAQALMKDLAHQDILEDTEEREKLTIGHADVKYDLYFQIPLGLSLLMLILSYLLPDTKRNN